MAATSKHITTFYCTVRVRREVVDRLHQAVADRPRDTLELQDWDDDLESDGWVSYFVKYGPVKGANKNDMKKFFDRLGSPYCLSERTETDYECDCGWDSPGTPCVATIYRTDRGEYKIGNPMWNPLRPRPANS